MTLPRRRPLRRVVLFDETEASLLDLVDNILNKGLMVSGDVVLSLADVDLVYLKLSALLCAADKVLHRRAGGSRRSEAGFVGPFAAAPTSPRRRRPGRA